MVCEIVDMFDAGPQKCMYIRISHGLTGMSGHLCRAAEAPPDCAAPPLSLSTPEAPKEGGHREREEGEKRGHATIGSQYCTFLYTSTPARADQKHVRIHAVQMGREARATCIMMLTICSIHIHVQVYMLVVKHLNPWH